MNKKILLIIILLFSLASITIALNANPYSIFEPSPTRTGFDTLSYDEIEIAKSISQLPELRSADPDRPLERLLVERHRETKEEMAGGIWDRRADVYLYDYETNETIFMIVNLETGQTDHYETIQNVQLLSNPTETKRALEIALADSAVWDDIVVWSSYFFPEKTIEYADITADAFIFEADANNITEGDLASCGLNRCLDLYLYLFYDTHLPTRPIVNLSTNEIYFFEG